MKSPPEVAVSNLGATQKDLNGSEKLVTIVRVRLHELQHLIEVQVHDDGRHLPHPR